MDCAQARSALHAYLDGECEPALKDQMAEHLRTCAECTKLADSQRALGGALRQIIPLTAPAGLRERIQEKLAQGVPPATKSTHVSSRASRFVFACKLVSAVAASLILTWYVARWWYVPIPRELMVHDLVAMHVRSLLPGHLTDVESSDHHTVKPWFTGRLDYAPWVEDLATKGFPLLGGRVDYVGGQRVAALVYQHGKHMINLIVRPSTYDHDGAFTATSDEGYHVRSWTVDGQSFTAISDMNSTDLQTFADDIHP